MSTYTYYYCPNYPSCRYRLSSPGVCPRCGKRLVPQQESEQG